jgi:MarR-like DNA-binding transcriptional regulator SgrR of sgrS sRNA
MSEPAPVDRDEVARFIGALRTGRANARTARDLAAYLGCTDRRLRQLAHAANEMGILVCADNAGYFLPAARTEVDETIGRLRSQSAEMTTRARRLEELANQRWPKPGAAGLLFDMSPRA